MPYMLPFAKNIHMNVQKTLNSFFFYQKDVLDYEEQLLCVI